MLFMYFPFLFGAGGDYQVPRSPRDPSGNSHSYCPWKVMKNHLVGFFLNVKILSRSSGQEDVAHPLIPALV